MAKGEANLEYFVLTIHRLSHPQCGPEANRTEVVSVWFISEESELVWSVHVCAKQNAD